MSVLRTQQMLVFVKSQSYTANDNRTYQYKLIGTIKRLDTMPITLSNTPSETTDWLRVISELPADGTDLYTKTENVLIVPTH